MRLAAFSGRPRCAVALPLVVFLSLFTCPALLQAQHDKPPAELWIDDCYGYGNACGSGCNRCGNGCCNNCCQTCGPSCWFGAEYLYWQLDGQKLPPLVTSAPGGTPIVDAGRLNDPSTTILSGNETVNDGWRSGYRLYAGMWLDPCQTVSIGADYFELCDDDYGFSAGPSSITIITRPFFNTELGEDDVELVNVPNELSGNVRVRATDDFRGAGIALERCIWQCCDPCGCGPTTRVNMLAGYRHYSYDSDLVITENLLVLPGTTSPLVPGTEIFVQDEFRTRTDFHGGEAGFRGWSLHDWWWVDGLAKVAVGSHRRTVVIDGQTINTVPGAGSAEFSGGLLTSEVTNIGRYRDRSMAVIPELRVGLGAIVGHGISVRAGYNLIAWNNVARAADQLPPGLAVDPRNLPPVQPGGGPEPELRKVHGTSLIAHGLDFGIQWMY